MAQHPYTIETDLTKLVTVIVPSIFAVDCESPHNSPHFSPPICCGSARVRVSYVALGPSARRSVNYASTLEPARALYPRALAAPRYDVWGEMRARPQLSREERTSARPAQRAAAQAPQAGQCVTSIRFGCSAGCLGTMTSSTPCRPRASIPSVFVPSGSENRRSNRPLTRSLRR